MMYRFLLVCFVIMLGTSAAFAQATRPATTQPASDSANKSLSPDQMLDQMLKPPANSGKSLTPLPERPTTDKSSTTAVKPNAPAVGVLREGTFIIDRVGRLTKTAD